MKTRNLIAIGCLLSAICQAALAQNTAFTYQGRVTDNGTNFSGTGQFEFALGTNTTTSGQTAGPVGGPVGGVMVSGGSVISITLIPAGNANANAGSGYTSPPTVTIQGSPGSSGATATAQIGGGSVTNVIVTSGGSGYVQDQVQVVFSAPQGGVVFTAVWSNDGSIPPGSSQPAPGQQPLNAVSVPVTNGLFTVVLGDTNLPNMTAISASLFTQPGLQLQIWFNDGANGFAALSPVQALTPTPYATYALNSPAGQQGIQGFQGIAGINGTNGLNGLNGTNGLNGLNGLNGTNGVNGTNGLPGSANAWSLTGSTGTSPTNGNFLGTTDNQPVELHVNGQRALRLEPNTNGAPNVIGGASVNFVSAGVVGATIGGGGATNFNNVAYTNSVTGNFGTVGGGFNNVSGVGATVGGGTYNIAIESGTVPGGSGNVADGMYSFAAGSGAGALNQGAFVWADSQGGFFASTANNQFLIRAQGGVGINTNNPSGAALNVNGKITSPLWKATTVINSFGPLPLTSGSFTTSGGTLVIAASGSGFSSSTALQIGMNIQLNGVTIDSNQIYCNGAFTHLAFVPKTIVKTGVLAGSHTLTLTILNSGTSTDANDNYCVTVMELPF